MKSIFIILLIAGILQTGCTSGGNETVQKDKYEAGKLSLEEVEKKSPADFLKVAGSDKKNLLGQTVVKGKVHNMAKIVTYKDVDIKLSFYSKTGTLLMEDNEVLYDKFEPGAIVPFKSKYFAPKGTDSIAMKVIAAKF